MTLDKTILISFETRRELGMLMYSGQNQVEGCHYLIFSFTIGRATFVLSHFGFSLTSRTRILLGYKWNDLGMTLTAEQWKRAQEGGAYSLNPCPTCPHPIKILYRLHFSKVRLSRMFPGVDQWHAVRGGSASPAIMIKKEKKVHKININIFHWSVLKMHFQYDSTHFDILLSKNRRIWVLCDQIQDRNPGWGSLLTAMHTN